MEEDTFLNVGEGSPLLTEQRKSRNMNSQLDSSYDESINVDRTSLLRQAITPRDAINSEKTEAAKKNRKAMLALIYATCFTFVFMVGEIVGGYLAHSLAIMTDAAHLLTDIAAMLLSVFAMHLAKRPADRHMTFGYHRAEILGALASIITIWALIAILVYEAILRLKADINQDGTPVDGKIMTIIGSAGLAVNIIDALILKWGNAPHGHSHGHAGGGGHSHGHGHEHKDKKKKEKKEIEAENGHTHKLDDKEAHKHKDKEGHKHKHDDHDEAHSHKEKKEKKKDGHSHGHKEKGDKKKVKHHENVNVRAAFLHVVGDCIQSLGVIAASLVIWIGNLLKYHKDSVKESYFNLADPIASLLFGIITLFTTLSLLKRIVDVLMERVPSDIDYDDIMRDLRAIDGILEVTDLHIWSVSVGKVALSVHVTSDDSVSALLQSQEVCLKHGIKHATIQVNPSKVNVTKLQCTGFDPM